MAPTFFDFSTVHYQYLVRFLDGGQPVGYYFSVVDVASKQVTGTMPGGKGSMAFAPMGDWRHAWITSPGEDKLFVLDLAEGTTVGSDDTLLRH